MDSASDTFTSGFSVDCTPVTGSSAATLFGATVTISLPTGCTLASATPATFALSGFTNPSPGTYPIGDFSLSTNDIAITGATVPAAGSDITFTTAYPTIPVSSYPGTLTDPTETQTITTPYLGGGGPLGVVQDGNEIWVANYYENSVSSYNATTGVPDNLITEVDSGVNTNSDTGYNFNLPATIAVNGNNLFVGNNGDYNITMFTYTGTCTNGSCTGGSWDFNQVIAVGAAGIVGGIADDGTNVWADDEEGNVVEEINATSGAIVTTIPDDSYPVGISSDGANVWVANYGNDCGDGNSVTEINAASATVTNTITLGTFGTCEADLTYPDGNGIGPFNLFSDGTYVWVADFGAPSDSFAGTGSNVTVISAATGVIVGTIPVGVGPGAIVSDGTNVWVANESDASVTEIVPNVNDLSASPTTSFSLPPGSDPSWIEAAGTQVWVSEFYNDGSDIPGLQEITNTPTVTMTAGAVSTTTTTANVAGSVNAEDSWMTGITFCYSSTSSDVTDASCTGSTEAASNPSASGGSATSESATLSGLSPATTYFVDLYGTVGATTYYGTPTSFTTAAVLTVVTTTPATSITKTAATLHGTVNAHGDPNVHTVAFCYSTTSFTTGNCSSASGEVTTAASPGTATGTSATAQSLGLSSLASGTTYYFELEATNSAGTTYPGGVQSFTTANTPTVTTASATAVTASGASLHGSVNANGDPNVTTIEFCYQTASFTTGNCAGALVAATPATASGTSPTTEGTTLSGLADATTYYVELEATNSLGTVTYGGVVSFTTGTIAVSTGSATSITKTAATLHGTVNANSDPSVTAIEFCYSTTSFTTGNCAGAPGEVTTASSPGTASGTSATAQSLGLTGLSSGTTYYVELEATNSAATVVYGGVVSFTTAAALTVVTTTPATSITTSAATLNGTVDANGDPNVTAIEFCYSTTSFTTGNCSSAVGEVTTAANPGTATGTSATAQSLGLTGLTSGTTYYFELEATNALSTTYPGGVQSFTTVAALTVVTSASTSITTSSATLHGTVNANGDPNVHTVEFCYSTTSFTTGNCAGAPGEVTTASSPGTASGTSATAQSLALTGLSSGTTYYFELEATNSVGVTYYGEVENFTTRMAYIVVYNPEGGVFSLSTDSSADFTTGDPALILPSPTYAGNTFDGWYTAQFGGVLVGGAGDLYTPSGSVPDIALYANWTPIVYTITFDPNGGSVTVGGGSASTIPVSEDFLWGSPALTLPTPTLNGNTFLGWETPGLVDVGVGGGAYTPTSSITLTAQWTATPTTDSVSFDPDTALGGTGTITALTGNDGSSVVLPGSTGLTAPSGYGTFAGWSTSASTSSVSYPVAFSANSSYVLGSVGVSVTLYAVWLPSGGGGGGSPPVFTSSYHPSFPFGSVESQPVTVTGTLPMTLSATYNGGALPAGVTFIDNGSGSGTLALDGSTIPGTYTLVFGAQNSVGVNSQIYTFTIESPYAPTSVVATTDLLAANTVFVTWNAPVEGSVNFYEITPTNASTGVTSATISAISTSSTCASSSGPGPLCFVVAGLIGGDTYDFIVTAVFNSVPVGTESSATSNYTLPTVVAPSGSTGANASGTESFSQNGSSTASVGTSGDTGYVSATGLGQGTVSVGVYNDNPAAGVFTPTSGSASYDVSISAGSQFSSVSFEICGVGSDGIIDWYDSLNGQSYPVTPAPVAVVGSPNCYTVNLNATSVPTSNDETLYGSLFFVPNPPSPPAPLIPPPAAPPTPPATPSTVSGPTPPVVVTAVPGNTTAKVTWTVPVSDGGSPITGYVVVSSPGKHTCTVTNPNQLTCVVPGLTNGTMYTFDVSAINAFGNGAPGGPSNPVVPRGPKSKKPLEVIVTLDPFVTGSAVLLPQMKVLLINLAKLIKADVAKSVIITGFTDSRSGAAYNLALGLSRASSANTFLRAELKRLGVKINFSIRVITKGLTSPAASNTTAAGEAKNRRVVLMGWLY